MQILIRIYAIINLVNGLVMLAAPETWYAITPGVSGTGPFNSHFVRDIGIAFIAASYGLWVGTAQPRPQSLAGPFVAVLFLGGHAVFHVVEMFTHHFDPNAIIRDLILIVIPATIAVVWLLQLNANRLKESIR